MGNGLANAAGISLSLCAVWACIYSFKQIIYGKAEKDMKTKEGFKNRYLCRKYNDRKAKARKLVLSAGFCAMGMLFGMSTWAAADDGTETKQEVSEANVESAEEDDGIILSDDASDFVLLSEAVPDAILEIRYYSTYNFVGDRIDGYEEPLAFLTREAAEALKEVSDELAEKGYRLKIYDAYRPQKAVTNFVNWAQDPDDTRMKEYFYPELDKDVLFPQGYIMEHSGHSRGSTVDLTLFDMNTEKEADMGGTFDYFGELSHPDYTDITEEQYNNRMILREAMLAHGFKPLAEEWWHFTLEDEPYPNTYFTFPVNSDSLKDEASPAGETSLADQDGSEKTDEAA